MYNLRISEYIKNRMKQLHMTYQQLEKSSGVPISTLHAYAKASVNTPKEDTLIRIAAAFGDTPGVLKQIEAECEQEMQKEKKLLNGQGGGDNDEERMRQFAELLRTSIATMLDEYRTQSATQQTEIIRHADSRVEEERRRADEMIEAERVRFNERVAEVTRQCNEEIDRAKKACEQDIRFNEEYCQQRIELTESHLNARIQDLKTHLAQVLSLQSEHGIEMRAKNDRSVQYLQSCVRNLSVISILLGIASIISACYAIYAYTTFDVHDLTQGLHQEHYTAGPILLSLFAAVIGLVLYKVLMIWFRKPELKHD